MAGTDGPSGGWYTSPDDLPPSQVFNDCPGGLAYCAPHHSEMCLYCSIDFSEHNKQMIAQAPPELRYVMLEYTPPPVDPQGPSHTHATAHTHTAAPTHAYSDGVRESVAATALSGDRMCISVPNVQKEGKRDLYVIVLEWRDPQGGTKSITLRKRYRCVCV